ncbi:hypothetical protein ABH912_002287 [Pseudomonas sp. BT76 TE3572]|nr:hypothetical protein [Pseudomonas mandelii]
MVRRELSSSPASQLIRPSTQSADVGTTLFIVGGMSLYPEFRGNG